MRAPRRADAGARPRTAVPLGPVVRVAAIATAVVAALYAVLVALLVTLVTHRLLSETDNRLAAQLAVYRTSAQQSPAAVAPLGDTDDVPVYVWRVAPDGTVTPAQRVSPTLPPSVLGSTTFPRTASLGGTQFRLGATRLPDGTMLVAAESLAEARHVRTLLLTMAAIVSPVLIGGAFLSALTIGRQAAKPIERARRRQLEFTADASHELRTPLTVIDAEVGLALSADRTAGGYRDALQRVSSETQRLRHIVEDLLWLARFDSEPPPPETELIDLPHIVRGCAARFAQIAALRGVSLRIEADDSGAAQIAAPPDWIDRLVGVLLDNALRHARDGGAVHVHVTAPAGHVVLSVSDDGPGIPPAERPRLFDRFHRGEGARGTGAGLGLAIGDAVVRSTQGRWEVAESPLGGALLSVTWARPHAARLPRPLARR
jgi:signal transduction histidine kinase